MKDLSKILVATDLTPASEDVVSLAVGLTHKFNSHLIITTVIPHVDSSPLPMETIKQGVTKLLSDVEERVRKQGVPSVATMVSTGTTYEQIVKTAVDHEANLVLIGAGNKEDTDRYQLGITAEKVMRACPKPVWVVKKGCMPDLGNILCPVDFSDAAGRALRNAITLAQAFAAKLTVLHVVDSLSNIYPGRPLVRPEEQGIYKNEQEKALTKFLQKFDFRDVDWTQKLMIGEPGEEIVKAARQMNASVIIMGSEGKTGLSRILMGSVAEKVVREVPCSIITVKSGESIFSE